MKIFFDKISFKNFKKLFKNLRTSMSQINFKIKFQFFKTHLKFIAI